MFLRCWLPFFLTKVEYIFFSCIPWCRCVELLFCSFGFFYSEFCGASLLLAPCMYLFSLWGASYLLAGGCASGALDMRLFVLWWFCSSDDYSFSNPFFLFFLRWCLIAILCVLKIALSHIYVFTFLWHMLVLAKTFYDKMR